VEATPERKPPNRGIEVKLLSHTSDPIRSLYVAYRTAYSALTPMQIEARINQDQNISKDLTLWNQQGSQVLRGQMLVLPVENTMLYIEPIYIQASQARMPQLKKIALAIGSRTIYSDTYEQALAELTGQSAQASRTSASAVVTDTKSQPMPPLDLRNLLGEISNRLRQYRDLMGQGKYSEAGREIEAVERLTKEGSDKR